jgi:hypothetical protein
LPSVRLIGSIDPGCINLFRTEDGANPFRGIGLVPFCTPTASSAPTTITDEIALVTDISGVCKAGVTDHTT